MHHDLKCDEHYFAAVKDGRKTFEIRLNDRGFNAGDTVTLNEVRNTTYHTGRKVEADITYVINYQQQPGWVVFSIKLRDAQQRQGEGS